MRMSFSPSTREGGRVSNLRFLIRSSFGMTEVFWDRHNIYINVSDNYIKLVLIKK